VQEESWEEDARTASHQLTEAFLSRHPRYRETLSLTPEHFRFDPVLWNSGVAALKELLRATAEEEGLSVDDNEVGEAVRNLVEGIMQRSTRWAPPAKEGPSDASEPSS
jgi:hypothetical protein